MFNCDLTSGIEDGSAGAILVAIVALVWKWWAGRKPAQP
jgi:hypothetical protein